MQAEGRNPGFAGGPRITLRKLRSIRATSAAFNPAVWQPALCHHAIARQGVIISVAGLLKQGGRRIVSKPPAWNYKAV